MGTSEGQGEGLNSPIPLHWWHAPFCLTVTHALVLLSPSFRKAEDIFRRFELSSKPFPSSLFFQPFRSRSIVNFSKSSIIPSSQRLTRTCVQVRWFQHLLFFVFLCAYLTHHLVYSWTAFPFLHLPDFCELKAFRGRSHSQYFPPLDRKEPHELSFSALTCPIQSFALFSEVKIIYVLRSLWQSTDSIFFWFCYQARVISNALSQLWGNLFMTKSFLNCAKSTSL